MPPRVLFAGLFHETHTFLPTPTPWSAFTVTRGSGIFAKLGDESPTDGFLSEARSLAWTVIPAIDARAMPSGPVTDEAFATFWSEFSACAHSALREGVDAVFLVLHGAMATLSLPDVEGELLERIRGLPGAARLPVFAVLDLHANISARMCQHASALVTYRANPHTDAKGAATRASRLLARCLSSGRIPHTLGCRVPIVWPPPGTGTQDDPMRTLVTLAAEAENAHDAIWACNIAAGFSFADTPDTGVSINIVCEDDGSLARQVLFNLADRAWALRDRGLVAYPTVDQVLATWRPDPRGPTLLVEPADNIGGGAPGDGTGILRALLSRSIARALVILNDPLAVAALRHVPLGGTRRLAIGGRGWPGDAGPVSLDLTLISQTDGRFTLEDPHSHLASMSGLHVDMGPCAVVRHAGITILLTSRKTPPFDLGQLRSQGLEPRTFALVGVKAAVAHRQAYDPIAAASFFVSTPGPCSSDLTTFAFHRLRRPIYPLDTITQPAFQLT